MVGIALNPASPLSLLDHILDKIDFVLIMTVNPGFGGQQFIPNMIEKISQCKEIIEKSGRDIKIEVDGGIGIDNIKAVKDAGADIFVAGSAIFKSKDYVDTISKMKELIK